MTKTIRYEAIEADSAVEARPGSNWWWYVATLARYVLVDAADENQARKKGRVALYDLYADMRRRLGQEVPIEVRTVRLATDDEIRLVNWHNAMVSQEAARSEA